MDSSHEAGEATTNTAIKEQTNVGQLVILRTGASVLLKCMKHRRYEAISSPTLGAVVVNQYR